MGTEREQTVTVTHHDADDHLSGTRHLGNGDSLTFAACEPGHCGADLTTPGIAGAITVRDSHTLISNHAHDTTITVWNLENNYQAIAVLPGQNAIPAPYEITCIGTPTGRVLTIYHPAARQSGLAWCTSSTGESAPTPDLPADSLDYGVYHALFTLRPSGRNHTPPEYLAVTPQQIAEHLGITTRDVHRAVEKLVALLDLEPPPSHTSAAWRSYLLAARAAATGFLSTPPLWNRRRVAAPPGRPRTARRPR